MPKKMDIMMGPFVMYSTSTSTTGSDTQTSSPWSLLDVLKSPTQSSLSRKHVVARNLPREKQKSWENSTNDPKA